MHRSKTGEEEEEGKKRVGMRQKGKTVAWLPFLSDCQIHCLFYFDIRLVAFGGSFESQDTQEGLLSGSNVDLVMFSSFRDHHPDH